MVHRHLFLCFIDLLKVVFFFQRNFSSKRNYIEELVRYKYLGDTKFTDKNKNITVNYCNNNYCNKKVTTRKNPDIDLGILDLFRVS